VIHGLDTSYLVAMEVRSHEDHSAARSRFQKLAKARDTFALAPQVLAEFIHVVTDAKRFSAPLKMKDAVERADMWWNATEIVHVFPNAESSLLFLRWLDQYGLGRKRLLDTLLASTLRAGGITSVLTLNRSDFAVFQTFSFPK
jgi:predicted nucleic acid-binding protein